ncbi:MAG: DUF3987 domain-containing protein, partial [Xanthobacteraceae bacterium]
EAFALELLPDRLAPWIDDIATRLQCPPDYPAITAMTALGAILGRKIAIKPQMKTDWIEIPNIWGVFIGPPGMLKSPAMNEALRPIHRLEAEAVRNNEIAQQAYSAGLDAFRLRKQVAAALAKEELKKTIKGDTHSRSIDLELGERPQAPTPVRYRTNDTSYEALAELIANNPTGLLVERDELVSLLRHLDRNDQAVARGFFLTGWSGTQPYTLDRISRGTRHIEAVCISVLGNSQPARITGIEQGPAHCTPGCRCAAHHKGGLRDQPCLWSTGRGASSDRRAAIASGTADVRRSSSRSTRPETDDAIVLQGPGTEKIKPSAGANHVHARRCAQKRGGRSTQA